MKVDPSPLPTQFRGEYTREGRTKNSADLKHAAFKVLCREGKGGRLVSDSGGAILREKL